MEEQIPETKPRYSYFLIPGSIVIAGFLIAVSLIAVNAEWFKAKDANNTEQFSIEDIKSLGKKIKLDTKAFNACIDNKELAGNVAEDEASASALGVKGTPTFFINGVKVEGAQPYQIFEQAIDSALSSKVPYVGEGDLLVNEGENIDGDANALVTIIEYSDFQCPFCKSFFDATLLDLRKNYIETGKVRMVYRHLPLTQIHPMARAYAEATECAGAQGKFWEMHDSIFML